MNEFSTPAFHARCYVPQSCEMSLVSAPFSFGGSLSRWNGCMYPEASAPVPGLKPN